MQKNLFILLTQQLLGETAIHYNKTPNLSIQFFFFNSNSLLFLIIPTPNVEKLVSYMILIITLNRNKIDAFFVYLP